MTPIPTGFSFKKWLLIVLLVSGIGAGVYGAHFALGFQDGDTGTGDGGERQPVYVVVEVVKPVTGGMDRTTTQPGTVLAYESVPLFAAVSGYLKTLHVDIGAQVKAGQVLAEIDVPELVLQLERHEAAVEQANAKVAQMAARINVAEADRSAAKAAVKQADAAAKSARAWLRYREKQFHRMEELFALKSIDERLVDETQERLEAAVESLRSAEETIEVAKAHELAVHAKIVQCKADVVETLAQVKVAEAEAKKSQEMVNYATIRAPFDGIITQRSVYPKHFIRAATLSTGQPPLLTVEMVHKMRIVVQIPDRDVPFADEGDAALVQFDALPGKAVEATISRIAGSEDPQTRLMRVEIDVPNPKGKIKQGMYGKVTIVLERGADLLSVPSACLVGRTDKGQGRVFVVRNGVAILTPVTIGADNGLRVGILNGLAGSDQVILRPPSNLTDGTIVSVAAKKSGGH